MFEISIKNLNKSNFYEKTLQIIEDLCSEYKIGTKFGILSMFNQVICDYLIAVESDFNCDFTINIIDDEVNFEYSVSNADFTAISVDTDKIGSPHYILSHLSDEISFLSDNKILTSTFHVKSRVNTIRRNIRENSIVESNIRKTLLGE